MSDTVANQAARCPAHPHTVIVYTWPDVAEPVDRVSHSVPQTKDNLFLCSYVGHLGGVGNRGRR